MAKCFNRYIYGKNGALGVLGDNTDMDTVVTMKTPFQKTLS